MKNIIMDFGLYYEIAKKKIKLKLWSAEYSKGYLYFFLNNVADVTEEQYNDCLLYTSPSPRDCS